MTEPDRHGRPWLRVTVRWVLALAVLVFVFRRLAADWPVVQHVLADVDARWLFLALVPGLLYFDLRVRAWQSILTSWGVRVPYPMAYRTLMTSEVLRYIPGMVWALIGRVARAAALQTSKSVIGISLFQEGMLQSLAAVLLTAVIALPLVNTLSISPVLPWLAVALCVVGVMIVLHPKTGAFLGRTLTRLLRRGEYAFGTMKGKAVAFPLYLAVWMLFAVFQVAVARAFGYATSINDAMLLSVAVLLGWAAGYVTVFAPSGIGVREAVVVLILTPAMGATDALIVAALTRVGLIVMELIALSLVVFIEPKPREYLSP